LLKIKNLNLYFNSKIKATLRRRNLNHQFNNKPSEELLSLGLNYLDQAIKCWETALDSIESAAYMQSQLLALPVRRKVSIKN
jgi:hypothetical protein